jgi:ABC-type nitrate/sulfonate/bicarbonate transport system permease component
MRMFRWNGRIIPGLISFAVIFAIWEVAAWRRWVNPVLLPPPSAIASTLWDILRAGTFVRPLAETFEILFIGYAIACLAGITIGIAMARSKAIYDLLEPLIELMRPVPKSALVPPLFLFLGFGAGMKITIVALGGFFPVLISTIQGVRGVDRVAIDTGRTFACSPFKSIISIILPAALPMILTGMRVALGLGLVLVVLAEMLAGEGGLGYLIVDMQRSFAVRQMYAWIFILGITGLILNGIFETLERRMVPWRSR